MSGIDWKWLPMQTAPRGCTEPGGAVRLRFFLGFCPDEVWPGNPQSGMRVCWWEPARNNPGEGEWMSDNGHVRPAYWMPLPAKGPRGWK